MKTNIRSFGWKTFSKGELFRFSVLMMLILFGITKATAQAPTVNAPTATSVGTSTATLGGTVTGTLTHRGTRWSATSPVGTSNELEVASTTAGAFTQARTGLPAGAKVFFVAYARNNADAGTTSESSFFTEPTQLTGGQFTATATSSDAINLTFPAADSWEGIGATGGYVIYRKSGSAPTVAGLTDGSAPPADGVGDKIATITDGTFTSFNNNAGLSPETNYFYAIVPFVWDGADATTYNYNLTSPQSVSDYTFAAEPSGHATGSLTANAVSGTQINLTFNSVTTSAITNADGYIVLIKSTAIVAGDLTTLTDGAAPNSFVLFKGIVNSSSDVSFSASGLSPSTTYHFAIIPFNRGADDQTYNYFTTTGFPTGSATTLTTTTVTPIAGGTAPVIASTLLSAGSTLQALTGFVVTSNGTQTISAIDFNYSATPTQFTTEYIYRSTTAGTLGSVILTDNTPDGNFDNWASVSAGNKTINSTPVYYYLVVDVANSVTSSTSSITVNPTQANITVSPGIVSNFSINRTFTFGTSQLSDIILNGGTTNPINYRTFVQTSINDNQSNSVSLADYQVRDGGGANDPDDKGMSVTSIEVQITNSENIRRIALFNDDTNTELAGTETADLTSTGTATILFTPSTPISVTDNGSYNLTVRAIFKSTVTDKQSIQVSITNVTTSGSNSSGFKPIITWASTQTANSTNIISVVASKFVFVANPPNTAINSNFSLTVRAVDGNPYNNIDADYAGKIDLTASVGSGTLTGGAQSLSPNLAAGVFTWNQLQINQSGTYSLSASDDDYTDPPESQNDIGDATGSVVISSSASTITQPATLNLCFGGIFKTLGNIVITETDPSGFSSSGSFSIGLPTGYVFDTSVTTAPVISNGTASPTALSYTGDNIVQFSYNFTAGTSNTNALTLSGLKIRYPGNTPPSGGGNITRVGGTAAIAGVVDGTVLGTLTAALATPPGNLGFTVLKINSGDANVDPNETRFSVSGSAVQLIGTPSGSSFEFNGPGVTFTSGQWRFNPSTLGVGTGYNITYKVRDGADQCEFTFTKSFEVYSSSITNLATSYCTNQDASLPLSVSETYIDTNIQEVVGITFNPITFTFSFIYQSNYNFDGFVYYNPSTNVYLDMPKQSTAPDVWVFDPKDPIYSAVYQSLPEGYGIRIGFRVKSTFSGGIRYQASFVEIRQAPTVTITSIINDFDEDDNSRFCNDQLPVTLTGSPANSSSSAQDEFFVDSAPQSATIGFNSGTSTWTFNPASVTGVSEGNPATFNILYRYTDKVNGCVSVSAPRQVRVYARPASVQASQILTNATQEICPGTPVNVINASPSAGVEYKWYKDNFPPLDPNPILVGNSFTPPADILTPGTYEYYVTRTLGKETIVFPGCESNRQASNPPTPFQVSVTVKPIPPPPTIPNLTREYCVNASVPPSALQVTGTSVKWYNNGTVIFTGDSPSAANLGIDNTKAGDYTFNLTQTLNGCEGVQQTTAPFTDRLSVKIKQLPDVAITSSDDADLNRICTTDGLIKFSAAEGSTVAANGTWSGTGLGGALTPNPLFGTVDLNPLNLSPGTYILQYAYTNPVTLCSNNFTKNFLIHPSVNVSVQASDACLGSPVVITNNSTINGTGTIDFASWDFDDRSALPLGNYNTSVNSNEGRTQGTYRAPTHLYTTTGNYQIIGELITNAGCTYKTPTLGVLISPLPKIDFAWRNVCRDGISNTQFLATETSTPQINISNYNWNFNVTNSLTFTNAGNGNNPTVNYNLDGKDSVRLIVTTAAGCQDTLTKPVYIVPKYPAILETVSYSQNFEASTDGWIAGGKNPSWSYEVLSLKGIETVATRGKGWDTNDGLGKNHNNRNEQSWVLSGCFNFSDAKKPVVIMDIFSETPSGVNGAVLQYNLNGNIEDDNSWTTLGDVDEGKNWYDATGISSKPGNQSSNDLGWSGDIRTLPAKYNSFANAAYKLDELIGENNVTFRIAFAAGNTQTDGFAFDNLFIGERSRMVLLENFTNTTLNASNHNNKYNDIGTDAELVKLQFHTPFPGEDLINKNNSPMHNSRTAFYGITAAPTMRIDGDFQSGAATSWIEEVYDDRVLIPSNFKIKIDTLKTDGKVRITNILTPISGEPITNLLDAHVFTVIAQKSVGNFEYVASEILPNPSGMKITPDLISGNQVTMEPLIWENQTGDAIVVFVQRIEGNNKNVLQAAALRTPPIPDLTTSIKDIRVDQINIYPNPASREFRVELPDLVQHDVSLQMIDQVGRKHDGGIIPAGSNTATVNVENLAGGIYILEIGSATTGILRKKIMVVMKN